MVTIDVSPQMLIGSASAILLTLLFTMQPHWLPRPLLRLLLRLAPENKFASKWRWVLLPGMDEAEDTRAYNDEAQQHLVKLHEAHGDMFLRQRHTGQPILFVRSAMGVRGVLLSDSFGKVWKTDPDSGPRKPSVVEYVHNLVQPLLHDPVFSKKGSANRDMRTMLGPLFHGSNKFAEGFAAEIDAALAKWPTGKAVDTLTLSHEVIRSSLYSAIAGNAAGSLHALATPAFDRTMRHFVGRYAQPSFDQATSDEDEATMKRLEVAARAAVVEFRAMYDAGTAGASHTLLAIMFEAGYTEAECAAVLCNVVIAGAEAPASALAHTLNELAFRPGIQQKLRWEIRSAVGSPTGEPCKELSRLPFVKDCVLEGLRLFAPATLIKRQALKDAVVEGVAVPAGTIVELCVTAIHLDPSQYAEPTVFNPGRVGPVAAPLLGKERAFMPFSGGPRGCPGRPLAITIMQIALAKVIQRFELHAAGPRAPSQGGRPHVRKFVEWPARGIPLRLEKHVTRPIASSRSADGNLPSLPSSPVGRDSQLPVAVPKKIPGSFSCDGRFALGMRTMSGSREGLPRMPIIAQGNQLGTSVEGLPRMPKLRAG
jgi:cytochrome P450